LVTGAGGSIGSELCRQIIRLNPSSLVLLDHSEFMLFQIDQELRRSLGEIDCDVPRVQVFTILGSTCDREQMDAVFLNHSVNTVFHAAAYKHVHLLEENVSQGVKNNVLGTLELIRCCESFQVDHAVLVSTDKAVRPSSVMGLSKRVSELAIQDAAARPNRTIFSIVRFGNVLGSNGSVIPIFRQQITGGGPVTVTDPEVTRYFMTIPEAASLVIQASALARGGDVFVLDMGDPVKIVSIAERLIKLAGRVPAYEKTQASNTIQVQFIGLKPGEKLHEELTFTDERQPTLHPKIFRVEEPTVESSKLATVLGHCVEQGDWDHNQLKGEMLSLVGDARFH
jgi:FlaA1/EpsC-like NDP-sugar epimerase